jgi:hypothetical protein
MFSSFQAKRDERQGRTVRPEDSTDPPACATCRGHGLDPQCVGHPQEGNRMLYCGCPTCDGDDLSVTLGHSDLAALAAD